MHPGYPPCRKQRLHSSYEKGLRVIVASLRIAASAARARAGQGQDRGSLSHPFPSPTRAGPGPTQNR
jgi:hypothetical protein